MRKLLCAAFLLGYFLYFSWDVLSVRFAPDDMGNIDYAWHLKPAKMLLAQVMPWREFYRPMASFFYAPILALFGLNPAPYHLVILLLLLANVYLVYRFARLLGCAELSAGLAALLACYHAGLTNLNYNIAFVYDVLCCFFYLCGFVYYARIRERGRFLRAGEVAVFLGLYLCALNSKEMAPTLPVMMLLYEWLYHKPARRNWKALALWLRGPGRVALFGGALNLVYLYGKLWRPNALAKISGYGPVFSRARVVDFQIRQFSDLFEKYFYFGWQDVLVIWVLLFYLAWRRDRPVLRFCWFFLLVTPLPIEFLEGRGGACLYIPFVGWAIFMSVVVVDLAGGIAGFLSREPVFRRLGRQGLFVTLIVAAVFLWAKQQTFLKQSFVKPAMAQMGELTWHVIEQFRALNPHVGHGTTLMFANDPFVDWDMAFIAELWFRDPTLRIWVLRKTPMTPEEIAHADYLFDYRDGKLVQIR